MNVARRQEPRDRATLVYFKISFRLRASLQLTRCRYAVHRCENKHKSRSDHLVSTQSKPQFLVRPMIFLTRADVAPISICIDHQLCCAPDCPTEISRSLDVCTPCQFLTVPSCRRSTFLLCVPFKVHANCHPGVILRKCFPEGSFDGVYSCLDRRCHDGRDPRWAFRGFALWHARRGSFEGSGRYHATFQLVMVL